MSSHSHDHIPQAFFIVSPYVGLLLTTLGQLMTVVLVFLFIPFYVRRFFILNVVRQLNPLEGKVTLC